MMMAEFDLCIFSYNSRGFDGCKQEFMKALTDIGGCLTIICNQENFILKDNEYVARQALPDHHLIFKPAIKEGFEGRPKNGMFVAVPLCLKERTKNVSPNSDRIQCVIIDNGIKTMIINTYFPTDPRNSAFDETELLLLLSNIESMVEENECQHVILTGDFNADFRRNSRFVTIIEEFVDKVGLINSWERYPVDFTHTMERENVTYTSIIDHFFLEYQP